MSRFPAERRSDADGRRLAVRAQALYLANLLILPGLAFAALLWLRRRRAGVPLLAQAHLDAALHASLWALALLPGVAGLLVLVAGPRAPATWMTLILWVVSMHTALVLWGLLALAAALAGRLPPPPWRGRISG